LREALTKQAPWQGLSDAQVVKRLASGGLSPLAEFGDYVSVRLVRLANECMQREPQQRPSAQLLSLRLSQLQSRGVDFFDNVTRTHEQMIQEDRLFYADTWDSCVRLQPSDNALLQPLLVALCKQFGSAKLQECEGTFESLRALADRESDQFHEQMRQFVAAAGGSYYRGPRKASTEAQVKVLRDYQGDYRRLLDYERGTGSFSGLSGLRGALSSLPLTVTRVKDRLYAGVFDTGYRDVLLNVGCNGFVGELQLTLDKLWARKEVAHRALLLQRLLDAAGQASKSEEHK